MCRTSQLEIWPCSLRCHRRHRPHPGRGALRRRGEELLQEGPASPTNLSTRTHTGRARWLMRSLFGDDARGREHQESVSDLLTLHDLLRPRISLRTTCHATPHERQTTKERSQASSFMALFRGAITQRLVCQIIVSPHRTPKSILNSLFLEWVHARKHEFTHRMRSRWAKLVSSLTQKCVLIERDPICHSNNTTL